MRPPAPGRADPLMPFRAHCRSCGDPILWATIERGVRMPLNEGPSYFGNITTMIEPATRRRPARLTATVLKISQIEGARSDGQRLYRSHFADCPDSRRHRRRKTR